MKLSVLLPTHNGGLQLLDSITSVLRQEYDDFELVISDNCSDPQTVAVIEKLLPNPRIKYFRHEQLLAVTDNWKAALAASSGDYFVMIGDDDCLLPGYLAVMSDLVHRYQQPDCINYLSYLFIFQGAVRQNTASYCDLQFGVPLPVTGAIPQRVRTELVRSLFRLRGGCFPNSQHTLVARAMLKKLTRGFYVAPFPDSYSTYALLLQADKFVHLPERLVVTGVSPKSAGHYYYNSRYSGFERYLSLTRAESADRGNPLLDNEVQVLEKLRMDFPEQLGGCVIDERDYRLRLAVSMCPQYALGLVGPGEVLFQSAWVTPGNWLTYFAPRFAYYSLRRLQRKITGHPSALEVMFRRARPFGRSELEFAQWIARERWAANGLADAADKLAQE